MISGSGASPQIWGQVISNVQTESSQIPLEVRGLSHTLILSTDRSQQQPLHIELDQTQVGRVGLAIELDQTQVVRVGLTIVRILKMPLQFQLNRYTFMGMMYLGASVGVGYLRPSVGQKKINDSTLAVAAFLSLVLGICSQAVLNAKVRYKIEDSALNVIVGFFEIARNVADKCPSSLNQLFARPFLPSYTQGCVKFLEKLTVGTLCAPLILMRFFIPMATPMILIELSTGLAQRIHGDEEYHLKFHLLIFALLMPLGFKHFHDVMHLNEITP